MPRTFLPAATLAAAASLAGIPVTAQSSDAGSDELPPILPVAREIALARSAAPAEVSRDATVLRLVRGKGFEVAAKGTNGVTCLVSRTWPDAIEPHCFDPEGSRTILQIHVHEAALREQGWTRDEIRADIAERLRTGRLTPPARPAVTWMMSAAQVLYNDDGVRVGAWKAHLDSLAGGAWIASNADYQAEDGGTDRYGMAYTLEPGALAATGCLWAERGGEVTDVAWNFFLGWDPVREAGLVYQSHPAGLVAIGYREARGPDEPELIQELWSPDGTTSRIGHIERWDGPDTRVSRSVDWRDDRWLPRRSYTWVRVRHREAPCHR